MCVCVGGGMKKERERENREGGCQGRVRERRRGEEEGWRGSER